MPWSLARLDLLFKEWLLSSSSWFVALLFLLFVMTIIYLLDTILVHLIE